MPFRIFETYVEEEGFCCPHALLAERRDWTAVGLAEDVGFSERAAKYWRMLFKRGKVRCARAPQCAIAKNRLRKTP